MLQRSVSPWVSQGDAAAEACWQSSEQSLAQCLDSQAQSLTKSTFWQAQKFNTGSSIAMTKVMRQSKNIPVMR
jgi:hypothetical protein